MDAGSSNSTPFTTDLPVVVLHRQPNLNPDDLVSHIRSFYRVVHSDSESDPNVRVLICLGRPLLTSDTFDRYPSLECVIGTTAGLDHVNLHECRRRGIRFTSNGGVFSDDVADFAVGLLIDVLRRVSAAHRFVRAGLCPVNGSFPLGSKVRSKRVGIVGLGSIGMRISKRLEAFGCVLAYTSRKLKPEFSFPYYANILELAAWSDVLILCCSYTSETHHIVNEDIMRVLGKDGIIINVGRGALVDEKELIQFLLSGEIGGAGLDVFENEPHVPEELFELDNVVLSPHTAVVTPESFGALRKLIVNNLEAFFSNKPLKGEMDLNDSSASRP